MFHQFNAATQFHAWKTNQPILLEVKQVTAFLSTLVVKRVKTTGNLGDLPFKNMTGGIKICQVTRLTLVFLSCVLNVLANFSFVYVMAPGPRPQGRVFLSLGSLLHCRTATREICENRSVPRPFPTILHRFLALAKSVRQTHVWWHDLRKVVYKSSLLWEYIHDTNGMISWLKLVVDYTADHGK